MTQTIGIIAGILTATSLLPQLLKILKEKKADDVSIVMLLVLMAGVALWVYYGILRDDWPIIITNAFSLTLNVVTLFFKVKYK